VAAPRLLICAPTRLQVRKLGYMFDTHMLDIATVEWKQVPA
jgi:hypothetical protein